MSSYHDLHVTTANIERTSIFNLPYGYEVSCSRVTGWHLRFEGELLAGEYDDRWLVLDVDGHEIVNSRPDGPRPSGPPGALPHGFTR